MHIRVVPNLHPVPDSRSNAAVQMSKRLCEKIVSEGGVGGEEEELCGGGHEGEEMDVWEEGLKG